MKRWVTLPLARERLRVEVELPDGQVAFEEVVPAINTLVQALVDAKRRHTADLGRPLTCASGCFACCTQIVPVNELELRWLRRVVAELEPDHRAHVEQRFEEIRESLDAFGLTARLDQPDPSAASNLALNRDYFVMGEGCPFLAADRSCSIYEHRPAICREYSVSSLPSHCSDPFRKPVSVVVSPVQVTQVVALLLERWLGRRGRVVPLSLGFDWLDDEDEPALVDAEAFFALVEAVVVQALEAAERKLLVDGEQA